MMCQGRELRSARFVIAVMALVIAARWLGAPSFVRAEDDEDRYVVVKTAKTVTISGDDIDGALIVIKGGKIEAVGKNVDYPSDSRVIDASDRVVMPGMINPRTKLGLPRLRRAGSQSHKKLSDIYYPPDDDTYRKLIEAGYTLIGIYADGSGLTGQGLVLSTHEPKAKSGVKTEGLVRVTFTRTSRDKKVLRDVLKKAADEIKKQEEAAKKAAESKPATQPAKGKGAKAPPKGAGPKSKPASGPTTKPAGKPASKPDKKPAKKPAKPVVRPDLVPVIALLKKTDGYMAHVEFGRASDLIHFAEVAKDREFARAYSLAAYSAADLHRVISHDLLGGADALIALRPEMPYMPLTVNRYNPARELSAVGCRVAFCPMTDDVAGHETMRQRLALLVRAGLSRGDALKAVTLHAAEYLGLQKTYGSIEAGRQADLIFLDGDPLDPHAKVQRVMIDGKMVVDLEEADR